MSQGCYKRAAGQSWAGVPARDCHKVHPERSTKRGGQGLNQSSRPHSGGWAGWSRSQAWPLRPAPRPGWVWLRLARLQSALPEAPSLSQTRLPRCLVSCPGGDQRTLPGSSVAPRLPGEASSLRRGPAHCPCHRLTMTLRHGSVAAERQGPVAEPLAAGHVRRGSRAARRPWSAPLWTAPSPCSVAVAPWLTQPCTRSPPGAL